jgi:nicotinamide-nucleotide amidase
MEEDVAALAKKLKAHEWKVATVESCTGGGLAYWLTQVSGSSEWFERGFVTYSNLAKQEMVGVREITLDTFGAVSAETATEMAEGGLRFSQAQISVAITGIAGPSGGTPDKPVGTVHFAWAGINFETILKKALLTGNRTEIREKSIAIALDGLLRILSE